MGFYTHDDLVDWKQWSVDSRAARAEPTSRIYEPDISLNLKTFLRYTLGAPWEIKIIRESGEVLIEHLRAFLAGCNQLTSFKRQQWLRLFPAWTAQERREQLLGARRRGRFLGALGSPDPRSGRRSISAGDPFILSCARLRGKNFGVA